MLVLLSAINAKYIHSSLALYSLAAYMEGSVPEKNNIVIKEFTINHHNDYILSEIYKLKPDILCFSCYIWSIGYIERVCRAIRKVLPKVVIILGGPEAGYEYENLLNTKTCDVIVTGEGEETLSELIRYYETDMECLDKIKGIAYYKNGVVTTQKREPLDLDKLRFPYHNGMEAFKNRIIYYEASRGCPFSCGYCISSLDKGVRFLPLERVYADLKFFIENKVPQVKFIDRTFNCDKTRALAIWLFLAENDAGTTNFHFEIAADLLTDKQLELLKTVRKGLFQFEIGVQSTNPETLKAINRQSDLPALFKRVTQLKSFSNINLHLDLIAGLPKENYESFKNSFNDVYSLEPETLQLGFLKLLKGLPLRCAKGMEYDEYPPYEVLKTDEISFEELQILKDIEELLSLYYNSRKAWYTLRYAVSKFKSAFEMYYLFSRYWVENGLYAVSHGKFELYTIFYEFLLSSAQEIIKPASCLLVFDMCKSENVKTFPYFVEEPKNRDVLRELYSKHVPKEKQRMFHIQQFDYDVLGWIADGGEIKARKNYVLFDYEDKRITEI